MIENEIFLKNFSKEIFFFSLDKISFLFVHNLTAQTYPLNIFIPHVDPHFSELAGHRRIWALNSFAQ